ncbi:MAG TPA: response regulator, partial [Thermoanaerobaculia bacterium]|nr:response regulator [Thermoanaerobaculia bacterium]
MSVAPPKKPLSSELLHDLRSPLNQIIGYSEILVEESLERKEAATDLQRIRSAGQRMLEIIEENFTAGENEPVHAAEVTPAQREEALSEQISTEPGLVLVVDDDAGNREVLARRLTRQGHNVETASNGQEALQLLAGKPFDLVLLDIMMPEMDGYEVLRHIKAGEEARHIPVIMISALHEVQSAVRCIEAGAEDYLTKPFEPTLLKARIDTCLEKKRGRDRETSLFAQLHQNFKRLEELEKLRVDMRNMIVHDLRTPLTAVIAGVDMLEKYGALNPTQREMMTIALGGGKTLLGMINDLLDVEKMEAGKTQLNYDELSAADVVACAIEQVALLARESRTTVLSEIAPQMPRFLADEKKITRTLVNLIANAIKFTGRGTVSVTASPVEPAGVRFTVRDTGPGIAPEAFDRIFEKFGQLDSRHKIGTGLGLAFCKLAVEAHGGQITVESAPGVGSTFAITLPRTPPSALLTGCLERGCPHPRPP